MSPPNLVVVSDLDGTLLDQKTYSYKASLPAIERLRKRRIPLILCSTKTRGEILPLWRELGLKDPFICESGGAIYLPRNYFRSSVAGLQPKGDFDAIELGAAISVLRRMLAETASACNVTYKSFGAMSLDEIAASTGLNPRQAMQAAEREYDEPFFLESGDAENFFAALRGQGLTITKGDRFHHVTGGHGKGEAVKRLLDQYCHQYGSITTVGLGNSANDLPFLLQVDRPVLVRNPDGLWDAAVLQNLPAVERTDGIGPHGWKEAIDHLLAESRG